MRARDIAAALGSACRSGHWWRCRCPVHCSHGPTLALQDGERGLVLKCHAGCSRDDVLTELRRRGLVKGGNYNRDRPKSAIRHTEPSINRGTERRVAMARQIWEAARDGRESPVARYLTGRRIIIPLPPSLRWAPACPHPSGIRVPAMVARVDNIEGELIGVHRTFMTADYRRRDRASLGPVGGGAVRLGPASGLLMVSEGIETALAAMQACALPAWAALSTSGMVTLALPLVAREVLILADNDRNGAGQRAAAASAQRWRRQGRRVSVWMSPHIGTDANDLLLVRGAAGARHAA